MSPPVDINENAPRAKESDFGEQKLKSFYSKLRSVVCKRFVPFELTSATNRLLIIASSQNYLARHFGTSKSLSARQIGETLSNLARHFRTTESCSARHFRTSLYVCSETCRHYSYLLRSSETSKSCQPAFLAVPRSSRGPKKHNKKTNFGRHDTNPLTLSLGAQVRWWLRPLPPWLRRGTAQGPSLGIKVKTERAGGR
jgi:hypothetical protein